MVQTRLEGKVTACKIGASSGTNVDIASSFKFFRWRSKSDTVTPQTAANSVAPIGWHQGHKWYEAELGVQSEAQDAFEGQGTLYVNRSGDNVVIPYFVITATNHLGSSLTITLSTTYVDYVEQPHEDYGTTITTYHLKANYLSGPTV